MKAILVDDEVIMLRSFMRNSAGIPELDIVAQFQNAEDALVYAKDHVFELALLDVCLCFSKMNGIELAVKLREIYPDLLIVFISAYDEYVRDSNKIGGDYYIVKPYTRKTIELMVEKMLLLSERFPKQIYIQMFGQFQVIKNGIPLNLRGKPKDILALIAAQCGKEISNEEIFYTIWNKQEYSSGAMKTYYNAVKRLKLLLAEAGIDNLILSTAHGQMLNILVCDGDYFQWKKQPESNRIYERNFLSEYEWGEDIWNQQFYKEDL